MSGSFSSGLLDSLAKPAQVNYLDVVDKASKAALYINEARKTQAQQLAGEAFQQSIKDGKPDQQALLSNLAGAGPGAALAAQSSAQAGQTLDQDALTTHLTRLAGMNQAAIALWAQHGGVVPQDALNQEIDTQGAKLGFSASDIAQAKAQFGNDPVANGQTILRNLNTNLSAQQALSASLKPTGTQNIGSAVVGTAGNASMSGQPQGPIAPAGQPIWVGVSPEFRDTPFEWKDATGKPVQGTHGTYAAAVAAGTAPAGQDTPTPPAPGATVPGAYQPRAGATPAAGGGAPAPAAPPAPATPSAASTGAAAGPPVSGKPQSSVQPTPALAPPPAAPPASPRYGLPGAAPGVVQSQEADVKAYQEGQAGIQVHQRNVQNLDTARQALALTQTGRSTEAVHDFYSFLKAQGITPPFGDGNVTQYDIARKAMVAFAAGAASSGGTDLSRMMSTDANANVHIDQDAAMHVLKQNLGWENQQIAMNQEAPAGGKDFHSHVAGFPTSTVPEAFAWDRLTPDERQAVIDRQSKVEGGTEMLHKSLEMAARRKLIALPSAKATTPTASAGPQKQSLLVPPASAGPQNYLAMAS